VSDAEKATLADIGTVLATSAAQGGSGGVV
jgi:hypothetical protein